jgi:arsenate reductase
MHSRVQGRDQARVRLPSSEGDTKPLVLFVCVHNAGRSRMAEAFFNELAAGRYRGISAGTQPAERPHAEVVAAMEEIGHTIENRPGRLLTQELAETAERVIGMGCAVEEACPALTVPLEDWELDDPKGKDPEAVADIRDKIEMKVRNLVAQLDRTSS